MLKWNYFKWTTLSTRISPEFFRNSNGRQTSTLGFRLNSWPYKDQIILTSNGRQRSFRLFEQNYVQTDGKITRVCQNVCLRSSVTRKKVEKVTNILVENVD